MREPALRTIIETRIRRPAAIAEAAAVDTAAGLIGAPGVPA